MKNREAQLTDNLSVVKGVIFFLLILLGAYYLYLGLMDEVFDKSLIGGIIIVLAFLLRFMVFPYLKKNGMAKI